MLEYGAEHQTFGNEAPRLQRLGNLERGRDGARRLGGLAEVRAEEEAGVMGNHRCAAMADLIGEKNAAFCER